MKQKVTKKNVAEHLTALFAEKKWVESLDLIKRFKVRNATMTKRTIKEKWKITDEQLGELNFLEVPNPYYSSVSAPMKLYLIAEINDKFSFSTSSN